MEVEVSDAASDGFAVAGGQKVQSQPEGVEVGC